MHPSSLLYRTHIHTRAAVSYRYRSPSTWTAAMETLFRKGKSRNSGNTNSGSNNNNNAFGSSSYTHNKSSSASTSASTTGSGPGSLSTPTELGGVPYTHIQPGPQPVAGPSTYRRNTSSTSTNTNAYANANALANGPDSVPLIEQISNPISNPALSREHESYSGYSGGGFGFGFDPGAGFGEGSNGKVPPPSASPNDVGDFGVNEMVRQGSYEYGNGHGYRGGSGGGSGSGSGNGSSAGLYSLASDTASLHSVASTITSQTSLRHTGDRYPAFNFSPTPQTHTSVSSLQKRPTPPPSSPSPSIVSTLIRPTPNGIVKSAGSLSTPREFSRPADVETERLYELFLAARHSPNDPALRALRSIPIEKKWQVVEQDARQKESKRNAMDQKAQRVQMREMSQEQNKHPPDYYIKKLLSREATKEDIQSLTICFRSYTIE